MSHTITLAHSTSLLHLPLCWPLTHGGELRGGLLAYELLGPQGAPLVIVQGGISAGRHVARGAGAASPGWWDDLVGPGRALDTTRLRVLATDPLGGGGASTGPVTSGQRPFPALTSTDQARALALLLDHLGERQPVAFVGASYGGMVGLALAAHEPARLRALVAISAADRAHPLATAWRSVQRRLVRLGREHGAPRQALALARGLAMATYRSARELEERFGGETEIVDGVPRFPVEAYLEARGDAFAESFDAEAYLCLSQAIDLHRVDAAAITTPTTLVAVESDQLVPVEQVRDLSRRLAGPVQLIELDSVYGHDAFLKESAALAPILRDALVATEVLS